MAETKLVDRPVTAGHEGRARSALLERAANTKRKYEVTNLSHVALVCADMERTTRFYTEVLHFPLSLTSYHPGVGQHFFFEYAEAQFIAFFWFEQAPPRIVNVTAPNFGYIDEKGEYEARIAGISAHGSMHHIAFQVSKAEMMRIHDDLVAKGIPVSNPKTSHEGESIYFQDPDGVCLEFCCADLRRKDDLDTSRVRDEPKTTTDQIPYSPSIDPSPSPHYYYLRPKFTLRE